MLLRFVVWLPGHCDAGLSWPWARLRWRSCRRRRRRRRGRNSAATGSLHGAPADDCRTRDRAHAIAMPLPLHNRNMMSIVTLILNIVSTFPQEKKNFQP